VSVITILPCDLVSSFEKLFSCQLLHPEVSFSVESPDWLPRISMDCVFFAKPFDQSIHQVYSSPFLKFVIGRRFFDSSSNPQKSQYLCKFRTVLVDNILHSQGIVVSGEVKATPRKTENRNTKHSMITQTEWLIQQSS
jgi:hypothetical protein